MSVSHCLSVSPSPTSIYPLSSFPLSLSSYFPIYSYFCSSFIFPSNCTLCQGSARDLLYNIRNLPRCLRTLRTLCLDDHSVTDDYRSSLRSASTSPSPSVRPSVRRSLRSTVPPPSLQTWKVPIEHIAKTRIRQIDVRLLWESREGVKKEGENDELWIQL